MSRLLGLFVLITLAPDAHAADRAPRLFVKALRANQPLKPRQQATVGRFLESALPGARPSLSSARVFVRADGTRAIHVDTREVHGGATMNLITSVHVHKNGELEITTAEASRRQIWIAPKSSDRVKANYDRVGTDPDFARKYLEGHNAHANHLYEMGY